MRILFIGGTGNISTDCAALLRQRGHQVILVTRGNNPVPAEYTAIKADRNKTDEMRGALKDVGVDVAINFLGYNLQQLETDYAVFKGRLSQYVFISTAMVYAKPHRFVPLTELHPRGNPYSDYAVNKEKCEDWLMERLKKDGFPSTIVRPSHTYCRKWIPNALTSAGYTFAARLEQGKPVLVPDDGENLWTLTASSDFAIGLAGLVGNPKAIGEAFHITSDEALSWNRIYREIADALGVKTANILKIPTDFICERFPEQIGSLRGDKINPGVFDNSKIKKFVPDFKCRKNFRAGIREAVAWFRENPDQKTIDPKADSLFDRITSAWLQK